GSYGPFAAAAWAPSGSPAAPSAVIVLRKSRLLPWSLMAVSLACNNSAPMRLPFYYGWVIVAAAFVTMAIGVNARTSFSLLFPPIIDEFGWPRAATVGTFSFGFLISAVLSPLLGRL